MDIFRVSAAFLAMFTALCVVTSGMSLPSNQLKDSSMAGPEDGTLEDGRRAPWLQNGDIEDDFKNLVLLTLQELANEGRIDEELLVQEPNKQKRGRWQGFCFRRTKSGRFLPYICWKGDRK